MYVTDKSKGEQVVEVDEIGRVLLDAAEYIERHGWCQNQTWNEDGAVCAEGAILCAAGETHGYKPAARLGAYLDLMEVNEIADWNDAPSRTKSEVVAALREAAKLECDNKWFWVNQGLRKWSRLA
jgi:hypothetical protein